MYTNRMSDDDLTLVTDTCLEHLRSLQDIKERLQTGSNIRGPQILCDRIEIFQPFLIDESALHERKKQFSGFVRSLQSLAKLLEEIHVFVLQYLEDTTSTWKFSREIATNDSLRTMKARELATFNQRIREMTTLLLPAIEIDAETIRLESFEEHLTIMLEDLVKEMKQESNKSQSLVRDLKSTTTKDHIEVMGGIQSLTELITGLSVHQQMLVESMSHQRQGVSLESIYIYDPMPQHFDDDEHILGRGAFATTFRVKCTQDQQQYAMKQVKTVTMQGSGIDMDKLQHEVRLLTYLTHPNIIRYFISFQSMDQKRFNIVMELADGGSLATKISDSTVSLVDILKWFQQCLSALDYMHEEKHIWHRDIKPENILLTSATSKQGETIKLADLGLACIAKSALSKHSTVGTMTYSSYEKAHGLRYDHKDDIWGLGCVFVELLTRKRLNGWGGGLYEHTHKEVIDRKQAILQVCQSRVMDNKESNYPSMSVLYTSVSSTLEYDPNQRPSAKELLTLLTPKDPPAKKICDGMIPVTSLSCPQAIQLLIYCGCCADLRDRLIKQDLADTINGEYVSDIDDIKVLQDLEENTTPKRKPMLKAILRKLQGLIESGLSQDVIDQFDQQIIQQQEKEKQQQQTQQKEEPLIVLSKPCIPVEEVRHPEPSSSITEAPSLSEVKTINAHPKRIHSIILSAQDNRLYSASEDRHIKVWDLTTYELLQSLPTHSGSIFCLALSHKRHRLYSGSEDKTIKVKQTQNYEPVITINTGGEVWCLHVDDDRDRLYSGSKFYKISIWDLANHDLIGMIAGHTNGIHSVVSSPFPTTALYSGSIDKTIRIWNTGSDQTSLISILQGHGKGIDCLILSLDGSRLYSGSGDKTIKIWDTQTFCCINTLEGHINRVKCMTLCCKTNRLISAASMAIKVWDVATCTCLKTIEPAHTKDIQSLTLSENGDLLYSASSDGTIKVWKIDG